MSIENKLKIQKEKLDDKIKTNKQKIRLLEYKINNKYALNKQKRKERIAAGMIVFGLIEKANIEITDYNLLYGFFLSFAKLTEAQKQNLIIQGLLQLELEKKQELKEETSELDL